MHLRILTILLIFSPSFLVTNATAQTTTTGNIEGIVSDRNGAVVPAVKVTVTSPNLINSQTSVTNSDGWYRILNLPPGKYVVTTEAKDGFDKAPPTNVDVSLSKTTKVPIRLEPQGATETVIVTTGSGGRIDTTSNTGGTNISTEQFSNFLTQRTVQSIYTIAPSVTRSGLRDVSGRDRDPSVAGSSGLENSYILDGVNTTDP